MSIFFKSLNIETQELDPYEISCTKTIYNNIYMYNYHCDVCCIKLVHELCTMLASVVGG